MHTEVDLNVKTLLKKFQWTDIVAFLWILLALLSLVPLVNRLETSLPVFTFVWLLVPLLALIKNRSAASIGFRPIGWRAFMLYGLINFALLALVMTLVEPWSHTYGILLDLALAAAHPDLTFAWVIRDSSASGLMCMFFFSGGVTLFGEELFFRGWLLQILLKRLRPAWAIMLQALLFSIPQAIAALFMPSLQAVLYIAVYSWLAIGVIGGWSAWRTNSIWPGLMAATLMNLILTRIFLGSM
jgi:membrane protease YdiL (CAAX protease family)